MFNGDVLKEKQTCPNHPEDWTELRSFNFPGATESAWTSFESRDSHADFRGTDGQFGLGEDGHQTGVH